MKRILYLHSGAEMYGADQILLKIVSSIDKKEFKPIVILPNKGPLYDELIKRSIDCRIIEYPIIRRKYFNIKGIIEYFFSYKRSCKQILEIVKKESIDIVHANTLAVLEGTYLKRHSNIFYISHIHEMLEKPRIVAKFLYKRQLKYCDEMIVVSNAVKNHISKMVNKNIGKIQVIHNGIEDYSKLQEKELKILKNNSIPKKSFVVAVIGRINAIKGQDHFIEAINYISKKNKEVYGLIIGDAFSGQEWRVEKLVNSINQLKNPNIIYTGFIKDIQKQYLNIDLLILPSVQNDSFPTVVLEAMSCGIPTVAYKCGGVEEMIKNGVNGYLIEQGNVEMLTKKINVLIENNNIYNSMVQKSMEIYKKQFNIDEFIKKIENEYRKKV